MKQLFILIGLLLLFSASSLAQIQFPNKNGEWYLHYFDPESDIYFPKPLYIEKDTVINDINYSKMGFEKNSNFADFLTAAIRNEDSKVYYIDLNNPSKQELILYDFGLNVGDSIELIHFISRGFIDTAMWTCGFVEYETVNNIDRKVIWLSSTTSKIPSPISWIEGVGSTMGPLYPLLCSYFEYFYDLSCYRENKMPLYGGSNCDKIVNLESFTTNNFKSYFDINQNQLIIKNIVEPYDLSVYNNLGGLIFSTNQCSDESIDLSWLEKGIYIYHITVGNHANQIYSQKFIVQ